MNKILKFELNLSNDLLYKGVGYKWQLSDTKNDETAEKIMSDIFKEDVGLNLNEPANLKELEGFKEQIQKIIDKKDTIKKQFSVKVRENNKEDESGRAVGIAVFPSIKQLIPLRLIGGERNQFQLANAFKKALNFGRKDSIPLKYFLQAVKTENIVWLTPLSCNEAKVQVLAKVVKWLWKILKRLIASEYYVTESQGMLYKLSFIKNNTWRSRTDKKFNSLVNRGSLKPLEKQETEEIVKIRNPAKVRWVPKKNDLRPIIFLKKTKFVNQKVQKETNEVKAFLNYLLKEEYKYSALNVKTLYAKWVEVVSRFQSSNCPKLHLVTLDINDAYGSIDQNLLLEILSLSIKSCFKAGAEELSAQFRSRGMNWRSSCVCEKVFKTSSQRSEVGAVKVSELVTRIEKIVKYQTVRKARRSYLLSNGISQAVSVSPALCNLYLAHFDRTCLGDFTSNKEDMLIRAVDDYLYVTPVEKRARRFLTFMKNGFTSYNLTVKSDKTQSSLLDPHTPIKFFGYHIVPSSLEIFVEYNDGNRLPFKFTMSFTNKIPLIDTLYDKMSRIPTYKLHQLTIDVLYMSLPGVAWNLFLTACQMACCFKATVHAMSPLRDAEPPSPEALIAVIKSRALAVATKVYKIRTVNDIHVRELYWIVIRAFWLCLQHSDDALVLLQPRIGEMEAASRARVRLRVIEQVSHFIQHLPRQFITGC